jgi:putative oxygen-independent coproporphyrinogen III oxidase
VCPYCDFNVHVRKTPPEKEYLKALSIELELQLNNQKIDSQATVLKSLYFGGGTPSIFSVNAINTLIEKILSRFKVDSSLEITIELNPEDLELKKINELKIGGVNRISLGVQSFNNSNLKLLGRKHEAEATFNTIAEVSQILDNISLDLIYALPEQNIENLKCDLEKFTQLPAKHISIYELTVELGTKFYKLFREKKISKPSDDKILEFNQLIFSQLVTEGFKKYELSSYCRDEKRSLHNSNYWLGGNYLGLGAGAHSYYKSGLKCLRWFNISKPEEYISRIRTNELAQAFVEELTKGQQIHEFFMLRLRRREGASLREFNNLFNISAFEIFNQELKQLAEEGLIEIGEKTINLTAKGENFADTVFSHFVNALL